MIADLKAREEEEEAELIPVSEGAELTQENDIFPGAPMGDVIATQVDSVRISFGDDESSFGVESIVTNDSCAPMDIFLGDPNPNVEFFPLVHLWLDLAANLEVEDIPDDLGLYQERDDIVRLIEEARARNPSLPQFVAPPPFGLDSVDDKSYFTRSHDGDVIDADADREDDEVVDLHSNVQPWQHCDIQASTLRPLKALRKACGHLRRLFRIPHIPVWP
ncbi:hypothetical protein C8Q74DRAFT_1372227 [Fomes fomentarius]|nr:hypothetical protein C8Q74DRAFT_1372227 [Fomes fomentarius]